jgi:hypothetical protein
MALLGLEGALKHYFIIKRSTHALDSQCQTVSDKPLSDWQLHCSCPVSMPPSKKHAGGCQQPRHQEWHSWFIRPCPEKHAHSILVLLVPEKHTQIALNPPTCAAHAVDDACLSAPAPQPSYVTQQLGAVICTATQIHRQSRHTASAPCHHLRKNSL